MSKDGAVKNFQREMGQRLKEERESNGITQSEAAEVIDKCVMQYQRYEYGTVALSCDKLYKLEKAFHFDVRYILTGKKDYFDVDLSFSKMPAEDRNACFIRLALYEGRILERLQKGDKEGGKSITGEKRHPHKKLENGQQQKKQ